MHMSYEDLLQSIQRAAIRQHDELQIIERGHEAPDHPVHIAIPEMDYIKMIILREL